MPRRPASARAALALLVLAAIAPAAAAAPASLTARALVDSVAAHYAALGAYHFEGSVVTRTTGDSTPPVPPIETRYTIAAVRPLRLRNDYSNPQRHMRWISDGESLYVHSLLEGAYIVQAAPRLGPGTNDDDPRAGLLEPLLTQTLLAQRLVSAEDAGRMVVRTGGGDVRCRLLRLTYAPDSTRPWVTEQPRILAIDESRRLVLFDSLAVDARHAQFGRMHQETVQRVTFADDRTGGPDSLYAFHPGSATRVADPNAQPPAPPPIVGTTGPDFTLTGLDGKRVSLASLRGHVVLLDFWATWCGPCRRWLPIVAKVEREVRAKGVRCFSVNERDPEPQVRSYLRAQKLDIPTLLDTEGNVGQDYGATAIPLTIVIGKDGVVVDALLGLHSEADLREALRKAGVTGI